MPVIRTIGALTPPLVDRDDAVLERTTMRRVSQRLLPFLFLLFIVCYIDRVNVAFAALQMNQALGFSGAVYGFGVGIFFVGYCLLEIPSNLALARVGARRWIARITISWGVISAALMFVRGPASFYTLRFLLGVAEAGYFPGIIYYLGEWFPARERARAISLFMTSTPLAGLVGGPLAGVVLGLDRRGGLAGWQWLFLLEGIPSFVLGFVTLAYLTDGPEAATWLSADERAWLTSRLAAERAGCRSRHDQHLGRALASPLVWRLALLQSLSITCGLYALSFWLPQIVKSLSGLGNLLVGVVSAAPYAVAATAMVVVGIHSDRQGERCAHVAGCSLLAAAGFAASAWLHAPVLGVAALCVAAAGVFSSMGPFWALPGSFLTGTAAAGSIALINSIANVMGFAVPYGLGLLKDATGGYTVGLSILALLPACGAVLALGMRRASVLTGETGGAPELARA